MTQRRWGFSGLSDAEYEQFTRGDDPPAAPAAARTRDEPVVQVSIDAHGDVVQVVVAEDWRERVDPRRLGAEVVTAAQVAVVGALEASTLGADAARVPAGPPGTAAGSGPVDLSPWGGSVPRLIAEAGADVHRFSAATAGLAQRVVTATSTGRHVSGAARAGAITDIDVDPGWAYRARVREVESELLEVLARLRRELVPEALRRGPSAPASRALLRLLADPAEYARRAGATP